MWKIKSTKWNELKIYLRIFRLSKIAKKKKKGILETSVYEYHQTTNDKLEKIRIAHRNDEINKTLLKEAYKHLRY